MAATFDSKSNGSFGAAISVAWAHTLGGGSNLVLAVFVGQADSATPPAVSTVTYGAQNLSQLASSRFSGANTSAEWWRLADGTAPSGNQTITVTVASGTPELACGAIVAKDASQATPVFGTVTGTNASGTAISRTVTSGTNELSICAFDQTIGTRGITTDTGTETWNIGIVGQSQSAGSYITGSASAVHTWTSSTSAEYSVVGVSIKAAAAAGGPVTPIMGMIGNLLYIQV